jgi:hypothetical protein
MYQLLVQQTGTASVPAQVDDKTTDLVFVYKAKQSVQKSAQRFLAIADHLY